MYDRADIIRLHGKQEHPENNKIVLERNGQVHDLLSIGEALELRNRIRNAGIEVVNDRKPVAVSNVPQAVSTFKIGCNIYKMYAL